MRTNTPLSQEILKLQARQLVRKLKATDQPLILAHALEKIAKDHGFRNWNTARAMLPPSISPPPTPRSVVDDFLTQVGRAPRVRHHSVLLPQEVSEAVALRRREYYLCMRSTTVAAAIQHELDTFRREIGDPSSPFAHSWALAVGASVRAFAPVQGMNRDIALQLELVPELLMPQKMERVADVIAKYGTAELVAEHFEPIWDFFTPFQTDQPYPVYYVDFLNAMGPFRDWFCARFGIEMHKGRQEQWKNLGDPF